MTPNLLLIEAEYTTLARVRSDPGFENAPIEVSESGPKALQALSDPSRAYSAILVSDRIQSPWAIPLVRKIKESRPVTPIYLIHGRQAPITLREADWLGISGALKRPFGLPDLFKLLPARLGSPRAPVELDFQAPAAAGASERPDTPERPDREEALHSVPLAQFIADATCPFDVFIRLADGRAVRVLNAKDAFTAAQLRKFSEHGVSALFLKKHALSRCLSYCDALAENLTGSETASAQLKWSALAAVGERVSAALRTDIAEPAARDRLLKSAEEFLGHLEKLVRSFRTETLDFSEVWAGNAAHSDHVVSVALCSAMTGAALGLTAERSAYLVGMTALLHDAAGAKRPDHERMAMLDALPPAHPARLAADATVSAESRKAYRAHPLRGAAMLEQMGLLDPVIIQAVAQHHERKRGESFPGKVSPDRIHLIAEIVGLSDQFVNLLGAEKALAQVDALALMRTSVFPRFSSKVTVAFSQAMLPAVPEKTAGPRRI